MNREEILKKEMEIAEAIFDTENDPDQMPINEESIVKLDEIYKDWLETEFDEKGEPISWSVILPTQKNLAEKFIRNEITEKELLDFTKPQEVFNALYIVSVITIPEKRNMGLAQKVIKRSILKVPLEKNSLIFAWASTEDGKKLISKINKKTNNLIKIKS